MPAHRHRTPGVKHKSTRDFDRQAYPRHSTPAGHHEGKVERGGVKASRSKAMPEYHNSPAVVVGFSPAGPDANHGLRQHSNTEQAHPVTLQRFDTEPSVFASQQLQSNTKRKQALGGKQQWEERKGRNSHFDMLISFTSHLGS